MRGHRTFVAAVSVATIAATVGAVASLPAQAASTAVRTHVVRPQQPWKAEHRTGTVRLKGDVPLAVRSLTTGSHALSVKTGAHSSSVQLEVNFGLPLRHMKALNALIATQARTHTRTSRASLYRRFAPSSAQLGALHSWLTNHGYTVSHISADRTSITAKAPTSTVETSLATKVNDYRRAAFSYHGVRVPAYSFYSNTANPRVPARLGLQSVTGLTNVARFFTDAQLARAANRKEARKSGPNGILTRAGGGYYPEDLRSMYDVAGHGIDATGQTIGFTLWGAGETQAAMNQFAATTGDTPITVDGACVATGNSPTTPSPCTTTQPAANHLESILENGNDNGASGSFEYAGNAETGLDIEQAHGMANGAAMKYYLADCSNTVPVGSGLSNAICNGSEVGMEDAVEDAADDPTLHTVSNSWAYGGDAEFGANDPFRLTVENSLAIAAAAGTTFWFSSGDGGTYESGYPSDSQYVVAVGGASDFSTASLAATPTVTAARSTQTAWAAGGSWCSNIEPRPSWQTGAAIAAKAPCPGRIIPDVSAVADTNTAVYEAYTSGVTAGVSTVRTGGVGGTSVAAPEMNGLEAVTEAYLAQQTYPGATPAIGFEGPMLYQLGNSANASGYFQDIACGNTASPSGGPDGDAAGAGWDPATGWGEIDWFNYSRGYAIALGATDLSQPSSLSNNYAFRCAQTPTNASERAISLPTNSVGYSVGSPSGATPWPATYLTRNAWGATNNFLKTTDGGATWQTTNSDMMGIACASSSTCVEVGDGGRIRRTTDSGATWSYVVSPFNKALTSVQCPSSGVCFAAGDRGTVLKSTDAGATWSFEASADGNPLYGLACPSTAICYAVDSYAHVEKTIDGGASWTLSATPITTPAVDVAGSGGPNPFAGLFGIACTGISTCVAVGGFPAAGTDPPILTTTNGGNSWTLEVSNAGASNYLNGVACVSATCYAVGRAGAIVTSTDGGATWTAMVSNTTNELTGISCPATANCIATGQAGTIDVLSGGVWTVTTALANSNFLASVVCRSASSCLAAGKQGATLAFDPTNVAASATLQAGGGTTSTMTGLSCVDAQHCVAVGQGGTILTTADGGQTWLPRTSGTTTSLTGVSCSGSMCEAVGGVVAGAAVIVGSVDGGVTWAAQASGATVALAAVSCQGPTTCVAVGTGGLILQTTTAGAAWVPQASGTTANLTGVACMAPNCYAVGAILAPATVATIVESTNSGASWSGRVSNSPQALSTISCTSAVACFAGGAIGTVVSTTDGGGSWTQQGDPISGPTSALNAGPTGITAVFAAACSSVSCDFGTASAGDIMTTPLQTVTVNATGTFGGTPALTGLSPSDPSVSYSVPGEAGNVTGTLTCTTGATSASDPGRYSILSCSGLSDPGYSLVYDLADSGYTVSQADQTITFGVIGTKALGDAAFAVDPTGTSGLPVSVGASGPCSLDSATAPANVTLTGTGTCTITASQGGDADYVAATSVVHSFNIAAQHQTITFDPLSNATLGGDPIALMATASSGLPLTYSATGGACKIVGTTAVIVDTGTCTVTASQAGDSTYGPAFANRTFTVGKATPTVAVASVIKHPRTGKGFVAVSVTGVAHFPPTGSVIVKIGAHTCTVTRLTSAGTGSCAVLMLGGTRTVKATYSGDPHYLATVATKTVTVSTVKPKLALSVHTTTASGGRVKVALTVRVRGVTGVVPTGRVLIRATVKGPAGAHCAAKLKHGSARCSLIAPKGHIRLAVMYSGDKNYTLEVKRASIKV